MVSVASLLAAVDLRNGQVPLVLLVISLHTKEECHLKYQIFSKVEERGKHQGKIQRLLATWMAMPLLSIVLAVVCFTWMSRAMHGLSSYKHKHLSLVHWGCLAW